MFQLPKTPHRPAAHNRLPPSPRRKRLCNKHPSLSPSRLRGSRAHHRCAPRIRPSPPSFTQDASPAIDSSHSPDVSYEITNPSSPLDRYNPTRKTAYKQLWIDCVPPSSELLIPSTSGNPGQLKIIQTDSRSRNKVTSAPRRTKFAPPQEVDDGVFFSSDPIPSTSLGLFGHPKPTAFCSGPVTTPATKKDGFTIPPLSFALDVDFLDLPSPYFRLQADSIAEDLPTNLPYSMFPTSLAHHADGPALAYYIN